MTVPVRAAAVGATFSLTLPSPDPLAPDVTVIQLALLADVHAQPPAAVTDTVTSPPPASSCWLCGAIETEQPAD